MPNIKRSPAPPAKTKAVAVKKAVPPAERFSARAAVRAAVGDPGHAIPYYQPEDLSRTHELIVDAVTALLSTGGHPDDVDSLLHAAMAHTRRRSVSDHCEDPGKHVSGFLRDHYEEWKHDLVAGWRKNRRNAPGAFEPKSITDRIRANVREAVADNFESFLKTASPEEIRLLENILLDRESNSFPAEYRCSEIFLGHAFERQFWGDHRYLRVPERMLDQVEKYLDALRAIEDKEVV